jgi:hypothetical protein
METASRLAQEHHLGRLLDEYRSSVFVQVLGVVGSALGLALALFLGCSRLAKAGWLPGWLEALFPLVLVGLAVYVVVGIGFFTLSTRWRTCVFAFERGLVSVEDSAAKVCRWDEVEEVTYSSEDTGVGREKVKTYTLHLSGGGVVVLSALKRFRQLTATVREKTLGRLLQTAVTTFQAGQPVLFGPAVSVDQEKLSVGETDVPWSDVLDISPSDKYGMILITRRGAWRKLSAGHLSDIPNYFVLVALVKEILKARSPARRDDEPERGGGDLLLAPGDGPIAQERPTPPPTLAQRWGAWTGLFWAVWLIAVDVAILHVCVYVWLGLDSTRLWAVLLRFPTMPLALLIAGLALVPAVVCTPVWFALELFGLSTPLRESSPPEETAVRA